MSTPEAKPHLQYGRDYLLQLRMHPLSIQRPKNLPDFEMVKEKLYLYQINSMTMFSSADFLPTNVQGDVLQSFANPDNSKNVLRQRRTLPSYFPTFYPLYASNQMCNATSQNVPFSKYRYASVPNYPLRKHSFPASSLYKNDASTNGIYYGNSHPMGPWTKHYYASGNTWNSHCELLHNCPTTTREVFEHISKSKKKLPIIDPRTGKNVLEAVNKFSSPTQDREFHNFLKQDVSTSFKMNLIEPCLQVTVTSSYSDENMFAENKNAESLEINFDEDHYCKSETDVRKFCDKMDVDYVNTANSPQICDEPTFISTSNNMLKNLNISLFNSSDEEAKEALPQAIGANENENSLTNINLEMYHKIDVASNSKDDSEQIFIGSFPCENDTNSLYLNAEKFNSDDDDKKFMANELLRDLCENIKGTNETSNMQTLNSNQYRRKNHSFLTKGHHSKKFEDELNENVTLLREKIYLMRQEQQKMAILQSFLRYKKHQLDEYARKLDDKKLELANWEFTLNAVYKKLKDKEYWLEAKREILKNREQQIEERAQLLKKRENESREDRGNHFGEQEILLEESYQERSDIKMEINQNENQKVKLSATSEFGDSVPVVEQTETVTKSEFNNFSEEFQNLKLQDVKVPLKQSENESHPNHKSECNRPETSQQVPYKNADSDLLRKTEQNMNEACPNATSENSDLKYNLSNPHIINTDSTVLLPTAFSDNETGSHGKLQHFENEHELNLDVLSSSKVIESNMCIINEKYPSILTQSKTHIISDRESSELNELGTLTRKSECTCKSGIESGGRQYFPEYIKMWLKKKERMLQNKC